MSCTNEELVAARVSNEEVEAARVYHAQGSVSQTTAQLHVNGKQEKNSCSNKGLGNIYLTRPY